MRKPLTLGRGDSPEFESINATDTINSIKQKLEQIVEDYRSSLEEKRIEFKKLLYKYWKLEYLNDDNVTFSTCLMFPYQYNPVNHYLFSLTVPLNDYKGGVLDISYHLDENFLLNNFKFTEITKEEFINTAETQCRKVLDYRLNRIKNVVLK